MKVKLYTVLALLFVCVKSFGAITTTIISPTASTIAPNQMYVNATVASTYDLQSVKGVINNGAISQELPFDSYNGHFIGAIDISSLPDGYFTFKVIVTDALNNVDSSATITLKHDHNYTPTTGAIKLPAVNSVNTSDIITVAATATVKGSYAVQTVKAIINGREQELKFSATYQDYRSTINLAGLPHTRLNLLVLVMDKYNNTDTVISQFYYHKPPKAAIIKNWNTAYQYPVAQQPFLRVKVGGAADSLPLDIKLYTGYTGRLLVQGNNQLDTLIDITGIAVPGQYQAFKEVVTDVFGFKDSLMYYYFYEPSPYLTLLDSALKFPVSAQGIYSYTSLEHYCDPYYNCADIPQGVYLKLVTPDSTLIIHTYIYYEDEGFYGYPQLVYKLNDNYILWQGDSKLYRQNLHTYAIDSFPGMFYSKTSSFILNNDGNFAILDTGFINRYYQGEIQKISLSNLQGVLLTGDSLLYTRNKNLHLYYNGTESLIDSNASRPFVKGQYIAYSKTGFYNQTVIWIHNSADNTNKRLTYNTSDAVVQELFNDGSMFYSIPGVGTTSYIDKNDSITVVANVGGYVRLNDKYYILSAAGHFLINLTIPADSLAPIRREVKKDSAISFAKTDFDNAYTGPGHVFKVKITGLPKHGTLFINKVPITLDSVVNHASLGGLSYKPNPGYSGKDTIHFTVWNGAEFVANDNIIQLSVVTTLPVKLLSFTGKALGKANQLKWQTAQEVNSSYFGVEKSTDGIHFTSIGNVTAKGNSSITESYEYLDAAPQAGLNYYRLKIVDKDASFGYSQTISIRNTGSYITLAYPNPARSFVNLSFNAARAGRYSFTVYNASGKAVSTNRYAVNTGSQNITLPLSNMASGTYVIKVLDSDGNAVTEQKVVKQ